MPRVGLDGLTINYEVQGEGEPLLLIHYTSADHASWAFQLPAYTEHFSCIALDLPGGGESDTPFRFHRGAASRHLKGRLLYSSGEWKNQSWPSGSRAPYSRTPYGWSTGSSMMSAPACAL